MLQVCDDTANMTVMCRLQTLKQVLDLTTNAFNQQPKQTVCQIQLQMLGWVKKVTSFDVPRCYQLRQTLF